MSMNKKNLPLLLVGIVLSILFVKYTNNEKSSLPEAADSIVTEDEGVDEDVATLPKNSSVAATPALPTEGASGFLPTEMAEPAVFENYKKSFSEMATCLTMITKPLNPNAEVNFETFNQTISPDLGDIVSQSEDWSTVDLRTPSGEVRRIFLKNYTPDDDDGKKTLRYTVITPDGKEKELPISQEIADDPSETLMASLESDGEVIGRSRARRIYYENGDVLLLGEHNGKISSYELAHGGSTYRCTNTDSSKTFSCRCF